MAQQETPYPVQFSVDYPDRQLNRLTSAFRLILAIPIFIIIAFVSGSSSVSFINETTGEEVAIGAGGLLFFAPLLMILFRQKYPRWWFDWNLALFRFTARFVCYLPLLRDEYPSTDEEQAVHLEIPYPDVEADLNRWLPLIKWFLAIPHYIVLIFLIIASIILVIITWFIILFTGRYHREIFNFVVGTLRWATRVEAYAFMLVTDRYPPFRLGP